MTCLTLAALCAILDAKLNPPQESYAPRIYPTASGRFNVVDGQNFITITEPVGCNADWSYQDITDESGHPWFTSRDLQNLSTEAKRLIVLRYIQDGDKCR